MICSANQLTGFYMMGTSVVKGLTKCINKSIETGYFPDSLKLANVAPVFKKEDPLDKSNYRPLSILPLLSKVYEKVIYNQLSDYSDSFLNNILSDFRKAHGQPQHTHQLEFLEQE